MMTNNRAMEVSLTQRVKAGLVPTLLFHGERDHLAPLPEFNGFTARMDALNNTYEQHVFPVGHFFRDNTADAEVARLTEAFLRKKGFLTE